jgi:hypothetical protein
MKTFAVAAAILGTTLVLISAPPDDSLSGHSGVTVAANTQPPTAPVAQPVAVASDPASPAIPAATLNEIINQYCVICHNEAVVAARTIGSPPVSFQGFDVDKAPEQWPMVERMIRKLRAGMMPPPGAPRPAGDTLLVLVQTLETKIDDAARSAPDPGTRRSSRLSRAEYERVIHDLLALDVDAAQWLPPDVLLGSFDNLSAAQGLSTTLLDSYLRAATEISRLAVGNPAAVSSTKKYANEIEISQHAWDRLEGAPFGTRGGMVITHDFPVDGEYVFEFSTNFGQGTSFEDLDVSIDGEGVALLALENGADNSVPIKTKPIFVRAGQHKVVGAFVRKIEGPYEDRLSPFQWSFVGGEDSQAWANYGITGLRHLTEILVTGPIRATGLSETPSRQKIFTCKPASAAEERTCAESIFTRLGAQAYRRPLPAEDLADLLSFYDRAAAAEGFEVGVRTGLQALLASPEFLFRLEREPASATAGESYRLSDLDLATRLSFLLWATGPDEELMSLASAGRLADDRVLEQQVRRMLADPRSEALSTRFAHQWLRLQDVRAVQPETFFYPDYTGQLGEAMIRETELFFDNLVREDKSLLELFSADYTFLNDRLAQHYGIDGIVGPEFRMVQYPDDRRRGILGHGSVLKLTSMSARTSPVLRGKWVMEVLMGTPPPPPPPNVPAFDQTPPSASGQRLTTRQRMERHRANPMCNACHRFMDPIGLALDNYDAVGRWRIRENMMPLDTRGDFYDGTPISTPSQLTQVILKRPIPLVRNFTSNLLGYAVGRPAEYFDQPAVRDIVREAEANNYRMSSFILGVVKSEPFLMKRSQTAADERGGR